MKIIKIEVYIFLIFLTLINLIAIVCSIEYLGDNIIYNYGGTAKTLAIVTVVAAGLQIFSNIIFIIIPRKGSRILFFLQLFIVLAFFASSVGFFLTHNHGQFASFWEIFPSVEGLNGLSGIIMLLILGREGWGDILTDDRPDQENNYIQHPNALPRFQQPAPQHPQQLHHQPQQQQYGYGPNKQY